MNERIKALAYQADKECVDAGLNQAWEWEKRFAELIILECEKVSKNPKWYSESPSDGWRNPIKYVCRAFKEHFGFKDE